MHAAELLKQFALSLGLPDLRFDHQGCASLSVDGHLQIHFERDTATDAIHLYSGIAQLPIDGREAMYLWLLEANFLGAQTAGATLAIHSAAQEVALCQRIAPQGLEAQDFLTLVQTFVDTAEHWCQQLERLQHSVQVAKPLASAASFT